jgi:hypothetical protein
MSYTHIKLPHIKVEGNYPIPPPFDRRVSKAYIIILVHGDLKT